MQTGGSLINNDQRTGSVNTTDIILTAYLLPVGGFGGLVVSMLASGTQDRGFAPDRSRRIYAAGKIHSMPSFGGEVK
jgi:hypothetical protein